MGAEALMVIERNVQDSTDRGRQCASHLRNSTTIRQGLLRIGTLRTLLIDSFTAMGWLRPDDARNAAPSSAVPIDATVHANEAHFQYGFPRQKKSHP